MSSDVTGPPVAFDIHDELPAPGITLLEASAGTGKTYAIADLATRYVAQGLPIGALLVITFTRAATSELRERVRSRFVMAERELDRFLATEKRDPDDLIVVLTEGDRDQVQQRRQRLAEALADFDSATIATTHGFCLDALARLGLVGDAELNPTFLTDVVQLRDQVLADEYVIEFGDQQDPLDASIAKGIVTEVIAAFDARIAPAVDPAVVDEVAQRVKLGLAARTQIARRKRVAGVSTYDDLISRLRDAVTDPLTGQQAISTLQDRYQVVLVDEFQDTDTVQWAALSAAFGDGPAVLLLIGDPKQAIYSFRGADIFAYLQASEQARVRRTLGRNFRSTPGVIQALDQFFDGAELGDRRIRYRKVVAATDDVGDRGVAPMRIRVLHQDAPVDFNKNGSVQKGSGDGFIAADVAADIVRRLDSADKVLPRHIGVLVSRHAEAALIQEALLQVGVPAVIRGAMNVFTTSAARSWLWLLGAIDRPSSGSAIRRLAHSVFVGWDAPRIADTDDTGWAALHRQVSDWADELSDHGVAALLDTVMRGHGVAQRLLCTDRGERDLTDLQHIGELLNDQAMAGHAGPGALANWLREHIEEQAKVTDEDASARRLDSDAEAVQVITIYAAKGLEFPVVYCPFLWHASRTGGSPATAVFHEDDERVIHVGGPNSDSYETAKKAHENEDRGEALRLIYVALTRAKLELVLWWAIPYGSASPLARILCQKSGQVSPANALDRITELGSARATIDVQLVRDQPSLTKWAGAGGPSATELSVNRLANVPDALWCRTSFSALTARAYEAHVGTERETSNKDDETDITDQGLGPLLGEDSEAVTASGRQQAELMAVTCPLTDVPGGASFGSFVHSVLEGTDFTASDLPEQLHVGIGEQLVWKSLAGVDPTALTAGLVAAIETPLGSDLNDVRLRDISPGNRINEMNFEFALAGGNTPTGELRIRAIRDVLKQHLRPDDVLVGYLGHLDSPDLDAVVRGFMAGSIDAILRTQTTGGQSLFSVVDYKTNRLGGQDLTAWDYRPDAVRDAVFDAHYPLQFLIYTVALHRYLRWRLPTYDPAAHLGPAKYLFLRGMLGADTPVVDEQRCGVFSWQPPAALICALSDLMTRGTGP